VSVATQRIPPTGPASALGTSRDLDRAVVAIDFDGTLSPMSPHPRDARIDPAAVHQLRRIAEAGATVAVVTGRSVESLLDVAGAELETIPRLAIEGMYGAEHLSNGVLTTVPTPRRIHRLREDLPVAITAAVSDPDVWIEDKRLSLVVHTRMTTDPRALQSALERPLGDVAAKHGMELHLGKEVLELRLPGIDKATALERLVDTTTRAVLYAGDDIGDLPAFAFVRRWRVRTGRPGVTVGVVTDAASPIAGVTDWELRDTAELTQTLRALGR
jgi:trehalose 6-phosphate phosphatase